MLFAVLPLLTINQTVIVTEPSISMGHVAKETLDAPAKQTTADDREGIKIDFTDVTIPQTVSPITAKVLEKQVDKLVEDFNKLADTLDQPKFVDPIQERKIDLPSKDSISKEKIVVPEKEEREKRSILEEKNISNTDHTNRVSSPKTETRKEETDKMSDGSAQKPIQKETVREQKKDPKKEESAQVSQPNVIPREGQISDKPKDSDTASKRKEVVQDNKITISEEKKILKTNESTAGSSPKGSDRKGETVAKSNEPAQPSKETKVTANEEKNGPKMKNADPKVVAKEEKIPADKSTGESSSKDTDRKEKKVPKHDVPVKPPKESNHVKQDSNMKDSVRVSEPKVAVHEKKILAEKKVPKTDESPGGSPPKESEKTVLKSDESSQKPSHKENAREGKIDSNKKESVQVSPSKETLSGDKAKNSVSVSKDEKEKITIPVQNKLPKTDDSESSPKETANKEKKESETKKSTPALPPKEIPREEKPVPKTVNSDPVSKRAEAVQDAKTAPNVVEKRETKKKVFGMHCDKSSLHECVA